MPKHLSDFLLPLRSVCLMKQVKMPLMVSPYSKRNKTMNQPIYECGGEEQIWRCAKSVERL